MNFTMTTFLTKTEFDRVKLVINQLGYEISDDQYVSNIVSQFQHRLGGARNVRAVINYALDYDLEYLQDHSYHSLDYITTHFMLDEDIIP